MITIVMMILSAEALMISQEQDEWSRARSIAFSCFSISVSAQLSVPVRFLICFSSDFFFFFLEIHKRVAPECSLKKENGGKDGAVWPSPLAGPCFSLT